MLIERAAGTRAARRRRAAPLRRRGGRRRRRARPVCRRDTQSVVARACGRGPAGIGRLGFGKGRRIIRVAGIGRSKTAAITAQRPDPAVAVLLIELRIVLRRSLQRLRRVKRIDPEAGSRSGFELRNPFGAGVRCPNIRIKAAFPLNLREKQVNRHAVLLRIRSRQRLELSRRICRLRPGWRTTKGRRRATQPDQLGGGVHQLRISYAARYRRACLRSCRAGSSSPDR
jgi:hypothetical protein